MSTRPSCQSIYLSKNAVGLYHKVDKLSVSRDYLQSRILAPVQNLFRVPGFGLIFRAGPRDREPEKSNVTLNGTAR